MKVSPGPLAGLLLFEPARHRDDRGFFVETFKEETYHRAGVSGPFVQDNWSHSHHKVLRGIHFQRLQGKLVTAVHGAIFDVAVDIRPDSETFGRWFGTELSSDNGRQLYIPPGFAHGLCAVTAEADVWYKVTDVYRPDEEGGISWNDPDIGIEWPVTNPIVSERDQRHPPLRDIDRGRLITRCEIDVLARRSETR